MLEVVVNRQVLCLLRSFQTIGKGVRARLSARLYAVST